LARGQENEASRDRRAIMSFDIFLVCLDHGEVATFPRALIERAFAPFIETREPNSWKLCDSLADVWIKGADDIAGFGVSRPPGDLEEPHPFWRALLDVMQRAQTVLHWPSVGPKPHAVVANESVIAHMPPDMIRILGRPKLVTKPEEFWQGIAESGA
jgi:hypothetical protein